ncbi:MAG: hypothetical protein COV46_00040 [Deltaproteobacteria bacterium CG11_big_fil_rev_8_21_14_0_20_49_13]|nr:MAG: hypothetical protein COV46_00040 [Deltaproteobacteria bacterium CG11_big_fil_rev_8_21_14_0_20_49_13]
MSLKSRYAIFERLNPEALFNTFLGMQPREQIIAMVATGIMLIIVIVMPISLAGGKISMMENEISTGREKINDVMREIADYNREKVKLSAIESQMKSGFDTSISTTLENIASQTGVKENVDSLKERPLIPSEIYDESSVDVRVSKLTIAQLIDYLYKIESERTRVLRIKQLHAKPRYDNKKLMDASFTVSTFKLSGEGG